MNHRKNRSLLSWVVLFFLLCFAGYSFSTARLFFRERWQAKLVPKWNIPAMEAVSGENPATPAVSIRETVIFPDEALVFLKYPPSSSLFTADAINCTYSAPNSTSPPQLELPPSSVGGDYDNHQIVRCPLPPRGAIVSLAVKHNGHLKPGPTYMFDSLAYDAVIDRDGTTVVFVKGLNLRSGKAADPAKFGCLYGWDLANPKLALRTDAISAAQEIVRCRTPLSLLKAPQRFTATSDDPIKVTVRVVGKRTVDSVARVRHRSYPEHLPGVRKQHGLCVCTMLRNQARFLHEWVMYHSRIGVERWFIYDNNSDDGIEDVLESLVGDGYNISRHPWPWIKTQEAGLAHCAMRARDSCEWVGFIDVDEFFHLPVRSSLYHVVAGGEPSSRAGDIGELRVSCHSFGPSGLKQVPQKGVTVGYTCRMALPERHKSIIRPEALNSTLINLVHHFHLKSEFKHVDLNRSEVVINHYKYQVWEVFKEKFQRRVATYVSDWQQERNVGSKDRAPGLGTKAVEPPDWSTRFCEVNDTRLRERVLESFADPETGRLPWEDLYERKSKT